MGKQGRPEEQLEACSSGPGRGGANSGGGLGRPCCSVLGRGGEEQRWSMLMPTFLSQATRWSVRQGSKVQVPSADVDTKRFIKSESGVYITGPDQR